MTVCCHLFRTPQVRNDSVLLRRATTVVHKAAFSVFLPCLWLTAQILHYTVGH